jgi:TonB family protein
MVGRCWWGRRKHIKRIFLYIVVTAFLLSSLGGAQSSVSPVSTPGPENGTLVSNTYANEFLGFWFPIPDGWQVNRESVGTEREGQAKRLPGGGLELLVLDRRTANPARNRIVISAVDASGYSSATKAFVSDFVRAPIDKTGGEVLREAFSVDFSGQHFFRADYKRVLKVGAQWGAFVCTKFSGYFIGWTFTAGSPEELEDIANSLQRLSFRDEPSPMMGIISSRPPAGVARPQRIRVSQRVSEGLLIKRMDPEYPDSARQKHVEGTVTLGAVIDKNGDVGQLSVVSGPTLLVPAALEAVRQWKYKPYLLQGEPLAMQTQIVVLFLSPPQ